eukprot:gene20334-22334_t
MRKIGQKKKLFALLTCLALYLVIGAFVFKAIEHGKDNSAERMLKIYNDLIAKSKDNLTVAEFHSTANAIRAVYQSSGGSEWTFYSSLYFCGSVVTTIGYGHMTPKTVPGRVIVMFYAIIGIPLNLWTLKVMGDTITSLLSKLISRIEKKIFKIHNETHLKLKVVAAMAALNIAMLLLGGAMYKWSENWTYLEGVYYCFIVYSTIGFGDLVPSEGHTVGRSNNDIVMMFVKAFNLITGLSLLSSLLSSIIHAADDIRVAFPKVTIHEMLKKNNRVAALDEEKGETKYHVTRVNVKTIENIEMDEKEEQISSNEVKNIPAVPSEVT